MRTLSDRIPGASNFTYNEFIKSSTALRKGINNIPPSDHIWNNIERLATLVLQPIRDEFGAITILSGYRSPKLNLEVGGSSTSNHCRGEAADIELFYSNMPLISIFNFIHEKLNYRWLICEYFPNGWIHVDYRISHNIKKIRLKDYDHNYSIVEANEISQIYGKG